jgi:hypothetical protein
VHFAQPNRATSSARSTDGGVQVNTSGAAVTVPDRVLGDGEKGPNGGRVLFPSRNGVVDQVAGNLVRRVR